MGGSRGPASVDASQNAPRRSSVLPAAIMMGVPLATGILALISFGPFQDTDLPRYVSHTVEKVEVFLFCGGARRVREQALAGLARKARLPYAICCPSGMEAGSSSRRLISFWLD